MARLTVWPCDARRPKKDDNEMTMRSWSYIQDADVLREIATRKDVEENIVCIECDDHLRMLDEVEKFVTEDDMDGVDSIFDDLAGIVEDDGNVTMPLIPNEKWHFIHIVKPLVISFHEYVADFMVHKAAYHGKRDLVVSSVDHEIDAFGALSQSTAQVIFDAICERNQSNHLLSHYVQAKDVPPDAPEAWEEQREILFYLSGLTVHDRQRADGSFVFRAFDFAGACCGSRVEDLKWESDRNTLTPLCLMKLHEKGRQRVAMTAISYALLFGAFEVVSYIHALGYRPIWSDLLHFLTICDEYKGGEMDYLIAWFFHLWDGPMEFSTDNKAQQRAFKYVHQGPTARGVPRGMANFTTQMLRFYFFGSLAVFIGPKDKAMWDLYMNYGFYDPPFLANDLCDQIWWNDCIFERLAYCTELLLKKTRFHFMSYFRNAEEDTQVIRKNFLKNCVLPSLIEYWCPPSARNARGSRRMFEKCFARIVRNAKLPLDSSFTEVMFCDPLRYPSFNEKEMAALVEQGMPVNHSDTKTIFGHTPLENALFQGDIKRVASLYTLGAEVTDGVQACARKVQSKKALVRCAEAKFPLVHLARKHSLPTDILMRIVGLCDQGFPRSRLAAMALF